MRMSTVKINEATLIKLVRESVEGMMDEYAYHERQNRNLSPEEYEQYIEKKRAAKKAYYERLRAQEAEKGSEGGAIDYHDYKHGNHPAIPLGGYLKESELRDIIKESVIRVLNEINGTGRDYATIKRTYDKMDRLGQHDRAYQLRKTYNQLANDPNSNVVAKYWLDSDDNVDFYEKDSENPTRNPIDYTPRTNRIRNEFNPETNSWNGGDGINRSDNPKEINDVVKHVKNVRPDSTLNKNDFRA